MMTVMINKKRAEGNVTHFGVSYTMQPGGTVVVLWSKLWVSTERKISLTKFHP